MIPFFGLSISRRSGCSTCGVGLTGLGGSYFGMVAANIAAAVEEIARGLAGVGVLGAAAAGGVAEAAGDEAGSKESSGAGAGWAITPDPPMPAAAKRERILGRRSMWKLRKRGLKKVSRQCWRRLF